MFITTHCFRDHHWFKGGLNNHLEHIFPCQFTHTAISHEKAFIKVIESMTYMLCYKLLYQRDVPGLSGRYS